MQPSAAQNSSNMLEMKSIFQLFDIENNQEIDIKQINQILRGLETLGIQNSSPQQVQVPVQQQPPPPPPQQQIQANLPPMYQGNHGRRLTLSKKFNSSENLEEAEKLNKTGQAESPTQQLSSNFIQVTELKYFPNNKTTMSFPDFCDIFNECMTNKDQHDELLQNSFGVFDYDEQGYIDSKKIKQVFETFKDKTSVEEIQSIIVIFQKLFKDVLKFCGVVNDRMTLNEFKEFFKKNL